MSNHYTYADSWTVIGVGIIPGAKKSKIEKYRQPIASHRATIDPDKDFQHSTEHLLVDICTSRVDDEISFIIRRTFPNIDFIQMVHTSLTNIARYSSVAYQPNHVQ